MIWQLASFVVTRTVLHSSSAWQVFSLLVSLILMLISYRWKTHFMLSQLPGVCVDVTPVRSALWRYDGEGGLNGMRRDRATQRRSLAWVWPSLVSRPAAHSKPGTGRAQRASPERQIPPDCRTVGATAVSGVRPPSLNVKRVLYGKPTDIRGVQMKTWGGGGEQTEEKWNGLLPGLPLSGAYRLRWVGNGHCPPSGAPAVVNK